MDPGDQGVALADWLRMPEYGPVVQVLSTVGKIRGDPGLFAHLVDYLSGPHLQEPCCRDQCRNLQEGAQIVAHFGVGGANAHVWRRSKDWSMTPAR